MLFRSFTLMAQMMMTNIDEFKDILLKVNADGSQVRLRDVARISVGAENYNAYGVYAKDGQIQPSASMAIMLGSGANAMATAQRVRAKVRELEIYFPPGVQALFPYDTTTFVKVSITERVSKLFDACPWWLREKIAPGSGGFMRALDIYVRCNYEIGRASCRERV